MLTPISSPDPSIARARRGLLPFLGLACGASVATIYYNQPLLAEISRAFHVSHGRGGTVAVATQLGYAAGILLFVPLGDVVERRRLILQLFAAVSLALTTAYLAPSFWILVAASVAIGMAASVTHIMVPLAQELVGPGQSGRALGTVMTGLLLGVLLGRTASGAVGDVLGWRFVFLLAAASTAAFVPLLWWRLPVLPPAHRLSYGAALRSLWDLARGEPLLREASTIGFLAFASFIAFWTNVAFFLGSPHYRLGAAAAGSFGLLGAGGALIASPAGRLADRYGPRRILALALALMSLAYLVLWIFGYHIAGLIAGVIALDIAQQSMQISNQSRIFTLSRAARSRLNTIYMIVFFLGGALGSALSAVAWSHWQWAGVCVWGLVLSALASLRHTFGARIPAHPRL
ncbi:MAG: MFS transporter [Bryobacteraceae bacterium]|jgi:predicted MFS family arabinose efflux permease